MNIGQPAQAARHDSRIALVLPSAHFRRDRSSARRWRRSTAPSSRAAAIPAWYRDGQVPDTIDGRFDMIAAMLALVLLRLEAEGEAGRGPSVLLTEIFIDDMDGDPAPDRHRRLCRRQACRPDDGRARRPARRLPRGAGAGRVRRARSRRNIFHEAPPSDEARRPGRRRGSSASPRRSTRAGARGAARRRRCHDRARIQPPGPRSTRSARRRARWRSRPSEAERAALAAALRPGRASTGSPPRLALTPQGRRDRRRAARSPPRSPRPASPPASRSTREIDAPFDILFRPQPDAGGADEEIELGESELDVVFYDGAAIDLGEAVAETLSLSLDPYPRAPDAEAGAQGGRGEERGGSRPVRARWPGSRTSCKP